MLPGDTQSASQGQMGNVGHMTCQLCGFSRHLGVQDVFQGQREAWFWGEKVRKHKIKLEALNDTSTIRVIKHSAALVAQSVLLYDHLQLVSVQVGTL